MVTLTYLTYPDSVGDECPIHGCGISTLAGHPEAGEVLDDMADHVVPSGLLSMEKVAE